MKKTAIVTGSSRGIGFAIARQLGLDGYNIVMVATGAQEKNQPALDTLQALGIDCAYVQANIGCTDDRKKILDTALAAFGRVDVLVNNAGVAPKVRADLLDMSEESFDYVVGINTKGNMFLTQLVAKQMIAQEPVDGRKGVIVNVSSCSSVVSSTNRGEYCVSKAGVSMLTTLYADRLARRGYPCQRGAPRCDCHRYDQQGAEQVRFPDRKRHLPHCPLGYAGGCSRCGQPAVQRPSALHHGQLP